MMAQLAQAPPAACPNTGSMTEIMHQGGLPMPELHLEQMISSLQRKRRRMLEGMSDQFRKKLTNTRFLAQKPSVLLIKICIVVFRMKKWPEHIGTVIFWINILLFHNRCNRLSLENLIVNFQWYVMNKTHNHMHGLKLQSCSVYIWFSYSATSTQCPFLLFVEVSNKTESKSCCLLSLRVLFLKDWF